MSKKVKGYFGGSSDKQYNIPGHAHGSLNNGWPTTLPREIGGAMNEIWDQIIGDGEAQPQGTTKQRARTDQSHAMPGSRGLEHVTITTAHTRWSPRSEVSDDTIHQVKEMLDSALPIVDDVIPKGSFFTGIPGFPGHFAAFTPHAGTLMVTVYNRGVSLVTFGVTGNPSTSMELWECLHASAQLPVLVAADNPPQVPWCGVRIEYGLLLAPPTDTLWLGDFERCVAWAWLEPDGDQYPHLAEMRKQNLPTREVPDECASPTVEAPQDGTQANEGLASPQDRTKRLLNRYFKGAEHMRVRIPYPQPLPEELAPWHCYTRDGGHAILSVPLDFYYDTQRRNEDCVVPVSVKTVLRRGYRILDGLVVVDVPYGPWGVEQDEDDYEFSDYDDASGF